MALPSMKAFKWQYFFNTDTGFNYYDMVNDYQTDPLEVIKSKILIRLGTIKGEWKDDPDFGLPLGAIKQNSNIPEIVAQLIADEILKVQYVTGVKLSSSNLDSNLRVFTGSYSVTTIYGQTDIEVTV